MKPIQLDFSDPLIVDACIEVDKLTPAVPPIAPAVTRSPGTYRYLLPGYWVDRDRLELVAPDGRRIAYETLLDQGLRVALFNSQPHHHRF